MKELTTCESYKYFRAVWMATEAIEVAAAPFLHNLCITCFPLIFGPPLLHTMSKVRCACSNILLFSLKWHPISMAFLLMFCRPWTSLTHLPSHFLLWAVLVQIKEGHKIEECIISLYNSHMKSTLIVWQMNEVIELSFFVPIPFL